jgi:alpha-N-arabinofuranosidase
MLHDFDNLAMANLAQTANVLSCLIKTDGEKFYRTPLYHVFEMFVPYMDSTGLMVTIEGNPDLKIDSQPSIQQVSVSAARTQDGKHFISLVNRHPDSSAAVAVSAGDTRNVLRARRLAAPRLDAVNSFSQPDHIHPVDLDGVDLSSLNLPPLSVTTLELD